MHSIAYRNIGTAQHVYMATLVNAVGSQLQDYAINYLGYPSSSSGYVPHSINDYYNAVSWSGLSDVIDDSVSPPQTISNPEFLANFPNAVDRQVIINIFNAENTGTAQGMKGPVIDNN